MPFSARNDIGGCNMQYNRKTQVMETRKFKGIVEMDDIFSEWVSNKTINVSFTRYVQAILDRGIWIRDLEKYKTLLNGGNNRNGIF